MKNMKRVEDLDASDLQAHAVWQYANIDEAGETLVRPIRRLPVTRLTDKVVGTRVRLSNGTILWGLLGNMDESNPRPTEHFLTLSILHANRWFTLARYHDIDYGEHGPDALARFLSLHVDEVFPIAYDIGAVAKGDPKVLVGMIPKEPHERLSRAEIIALAVPWFLEVVTRSHNSIERWRRIAALHNGRIPPEYLIPDCVHEAILAFLRAIDEGLLPLSFTTENGDVVDLVKDGQGELAAHYAEWRAKYSQQRIGDDAEST